MKVRFTLLLGLLILAFNGKAQVHKYWIGDTAHVRIMYDTLMNPVPDTMALTKGMNTEDCYIYWDKEFEHLCSTQIRNRKGNDTTRYRNGRADIVYHFKVEGDEMGYQEGWYNDGKKKIETIYEGDKKYVKYYYHDGKLKQKETHVKISRNGDSYFVWMYVEEWCENGNVMYADSIIYFKPKLVTCYYCNGKKSYEMIKAGPYGFGKYMRWYDNGQVEVEGQNDSIEKMAG